MHDPNCKRYKTFIFPISFFGLIGLTVYGIIFTPEAFATIVLIILIIWVYKTTRVVIFSLRNYMEIEINKQYNWKAKLERLSNLKTYIMMLKRDKKVLDASFNFSSMTIWDKLLLRVSPYARFYSSFLAINKEISEITSQEIKAIPNPTQIKNLLVIAAYKERIETLSETFQALTEQSYDKQNLIIVLAMEARDKTADMVYNTMREKFSNKLPNILYTKHVLEKNEKAGKGSNCRASLQQIIPSLESQGIDLCNVIVTITDADVIFNRNYFSCLTYTFCKDPMRYTTMYRGITIFTYNFKDLNSLGQITASINTLGTLSMMKSRYIHPQSTVSLSLQTLSQIDFWDPSVMSDDEHLYKKMFLTYKHDFKLTPIPVELYMCTPNSEKYIGSFKTLYEQIQRWTYGTLLLNQNAFVEFAANDELPIKDRIFGSIDKIERTILWPFYSLAIVFGLTIIQIIRTSFYSSVFTLYTHYLSIFITFINIALLISLIAIDYYIRSQEEFSKLKIFTEIVHLFRWIFIPVVSIYLGFIPYVDSNLRIALGKQLEFKRSSKIAVKQEEEINLK